MTDRTDGERLAVLEDNVAKIEKRIEQDGEHVWAAIDKLRGCITASNKALRDHLDGKFSRLYLMLVSILASMAGYLFVKAMGW